MPPLLQQGSAANQPIGRKARQVQWGGIAYVDESAVSQAISGIGASTGEACSASSALERWVQRVAADLAHMKALGCSSLECRGYCKRAIAHGGPFNSSELEAALRILYLAIDEIYEV